MTTIELIQAEIGRIPEQRLGDLYLLIKHFAEAKPANGATGIMTKLREIEIEGPADFSTNLDLYLNGEKRVGEDLH